jgi:ubiquinone/menaquinone biosynthesis C-methylase UbiE
MDATKLGWAFRHGWYDFLRPSNYDESMRDAVAALELKPGERALDAGCGSGRSLLYAQGWLRSGGGRLTLVDIDDGGLDFARRRAQRLGVAGRVELRRGDLTRLSDVPLEPFDAALAHFSVYAIRTAEGRRAALTQLVERLRPGGRLVIAVPSENYRVEPLMADARRAEAERSDVPSIVRTLRARFVYPITHWGIANVEKALDNDVFHRYTEDELREQLVAAGLADVRIAPTYGGCGHRAVARRAPTA